MEICKGKRASDPKVSFYGEMYKLQLLGWDLEKKKTVTKINNKNVKSLPQEVTVLS